MYPIINLRVFMYEAEECEKPAYCHVVRTRDHEPKVRKLEAYRLEEDREGMKSMLKIVKNIFSLSPQDSR